MHSVVNAKQKHTYRIWLELSLWLLCRLYVKEGRKEMFIFNDALNTFYLRLYSAGHMVKDHSESERGNPLPPLHGLLFPISSKGCFICTIPTNRILQPRYLLTQLWSTSWNKKYLNGSTMRNRLREHKCWARIDLSYLYILTNIGHIDWKTVNESMFNATGKIGY